MVFDKSNDGTMYSIAPLSMTHLIRNIELMWDERQKCTDLPVLIALGWILPFIE